MNSSDLITEGISLMLFGMGFVFLFLTSLVIVTSVMSKVVQRYFQEPLIAPNNTRSNALTTVNNGELVAAITVAIHQHRRRQNQQK